MSKHKAGLHKGVSAIFDGISLSKEDGAQQPSGAPAPEHPDYVTPEPPTPKPSTPKPPAKPPAKPSAKPPAPSHMTPTKPKPKQPPMELPPKVAPAKRPKAHTITKAVGQTPWKRTLEQMKNKLFASKPGVNTARQKKMVVLAPVLFIFLIFMFIRAFSTPSQKTAKAKTFGPTKAAAGSYSEADWQIPELYPTTLRDPMQFGSVTTGETGTRTNELIVKGIVYSEDNPSAVIGDQVLHEGDKVSDIAIIKINKDSVEFEADGKRWTQKVQR